MSLKPVKLLAAAVILTCGLGLSVGTGWVTNAEAQSPEEKYGVPVNPKADAEDEVMRLKAQLEKAIAAEQAARQELRLHLKVTTVTDKPDLHIPGFKTTWWEYDLVDMAATFDKVKFGAFLQEREAKGWEFLGSTTLGKNGGEFQWLFRRPVGVRSVEMAPFALTPEGVRGLQFLSAVAKVEDAKSIEAEIKKLREKLNGLQGTTPRVIFGKDVLPLEPAEFVALLSKMAEKKFGKGRATVSSSELGIEVRGDKEVGDWAIGLAKALSGGTPEGRR